MPCILSDCCSCKNFIDNPEKKLICRAFPDEIPSEWFWKKGPRNRDLICNGEYKYEPMDD